MLELIADLELVADLELLADLESITNLELIANLELKHIIKICFHTKNQPIAQSVSEL